MQNSARVLESFYGFSLMFKIMVRILQKREKNKYEYSDKYVTVSSD